jgi:acylphosphatase
MIAKKFLISGMVQGVSFRYYTQREANRLGLSGYVKNLRDGRVEAFAQGESKLIDQFYLKILQGPPASKVDNIVIIDELPESSLAVFQIRF